MSVANGYATVEQVKERMLKIFTYTASTISFDSTTKTISDSAFGLKRFEDANNISTTIRVSGAKNSTNNTLMTISSVTPSAIVVTNSLTSEAAGSSVTITMHLGQEWEATLEAIIETASRWIDKYCDRRFYANAETRHYDAISLNEVQVDDIISFTTLKTDQDGDGVYEVSWTEGTHYIGHPYNALKDGKPYTLVKRIGASGYEFPAGATKCVQIYGSFGYCTSGNHPKPIQEACILQSIKLFKRMDAPFGIAGANQFGVLQTVPELDNDVKLLLDSYRRLI